MGFPCGRVRKCVVLATQNLSLPHINVLNHVKIIFILIISQLHPITALQKALSLACRRISVYLHDEDGSDDMSTSSDRNRPSPSLVQLPPHIIAQSINAKLPLVLYGQLVVERNKSPARTRAHELLTAYDDEERICVVCRDMVELDHEVRELPNCCHVFHADCLDGWTDQGRFTCPLCRAKLEVIDEEEEVMKGEGRSDPWRKERMIYLFGEDIVMS